MEALKKTKSDNFVAEIIDELIECAFRVVTEKQKNEKVSDKTLQQVSRDESSEDLTVLCDNNDKTSPKNDFSVTEKDIEQMFGSPYHQLKKNVFVDGNMVSYVAPNFNDLLQSEKGFQIIILS